MTIRKGVIPFHLTTTVVSYRVCQDKSS